MEMGYAQGIESFRKVLNDMVERKWLTKIEERNGKFALGMPNLPLLDLKYGIDIIWIGARTTANPFSVQGIADVLKGADIPVMVKDVPVS